MLYIACCNCSDFNNRSGMEIGHGAVVNSYNNILIILMQYTGGGWFSLQEVNISLQWILMDNGRWLHFLDGQKYTERFPSAHMRNHINTISHHYYVHRWVEVRLECRCVGRVWVGVWVWAVRTKAPSGNFSIVKHFDFVKYEHDPLNPRCPDSYLWRYLSNMNVLSKSNSCFHAIENDEIVANNPHPMPVIANLRGLCQFLSDFVINPIKHNVHWDY